MRSSAVLAFLGASLAVAAPAHQALHKKALVTELVTNVVFVTVTAGDIPTTVSSQPEPTTVVIKHTIFASPKPSTLTKTTSTKPPPPPPTTTSTPAPVQQPTVEAAPVKAASSPAPVVQVAATPAAPASASPTDYKSTALYHHKMHRQNHTAEELTWDDTLASYAETIAKTCVFAHDMTQGGGGYGQNLAAYGTSSDLNSLDLSTLVADAITNQWYYGEAANVPYGQDSPAVTNVPEFLHFTQVVWKGTSKVGCYTAQCGKGTVFPDHSLYTVCNYRSTGNVLGSFSSQVSKPIGLAGITAHIS